MVAVWFAALLGIVCFLLPVALVETAVSAARVADYVPAAAAPLGQTARVALSIVAACAGGLIGFVLARIIAQPAAGRSVNARIETQYFISAHEQLGEEGFDRPLGAYLTDNEMDDYEMTIDEMADADEADGTDAYPPAAAFESEPSPVTAWEPEPTLHETAPAAQDDETPRTPSAADILLAKPLPEMGMVELVERFALSLQRYSLPQSSHAASRQHPASAQQIFPADFMAGNPRRPFERPRIVADHGAATGDQTDFAANPAETANSAQTGNPAETERALRDALAKLQRMSGAA